MMKIRRVLIIVISFLLINSGLLAQEPDGLFAPTLNQTWGRTYLFGGEKDGGVKSNELWRGNYGLGQQTWEQMTPGGDIPDPVKEHAAIADWGIIWVIGGLTDANENNADADLTIHKYSLEDDAWELLVPTSTNNPKRMNSHAAELIDGYLYVSYQDQMWRFELETSAWEKLADCPYYDANSYNLQWHNTATYDSKFYVMRGGMGMGSDIYEYDPDANAWSSIQTSTPLKTGSVNGGDVGPPPDLWGSCSWQEGSLVFFVGGRDASNSQIAGDCWYFNFTNLSWVKSDVYEKRYHGAASQATSYEKRQGVIYGGIDEDGDPPKKDIVVVIPPVDGKKMLSMDIDPSPAGASTVTPAPGKHEYPNDEEVTLTANPDTENGWNFTRWSGDKSGNESPTIIIMNTDKIVTGHFVQPVITFSTPGPERKVEHPKDIAEISAVEIMTVTLTANEVDDWVLSRLKFKRLSSVAYGISSVFLSLPDINVDGEMDESQMNFTFNINPGLIIPKGTSVSVTLNYHVVLDEEDKDCGMRSLVDFQAEISGAPDVTCLPLVYEYGKKVGPRLKSKMTFVACVYNLAKWGFNSVGQATSHETTVDNDVITVMPGEYSGLGGVSKPVTVKSLNGYEDTWVVGGGILIASSDVTIQGLGFRDAKKAIGWYAEGENYTIKENKFDNCENGIWFFPSYPDNTLNNLNIQDNRFELGSGQCGFYINGRINGGSIDGNRDNSPDSYSIISGIRELSIWNNTFNHFIVSNSGIADRTTVDVMENMIKSLDIDDCWHINVSDNTLGGSNKPGLKLSNGRFTQVIGNIIKDTRKSNTIDINGYHNIIENNDIYNSTSYGIYIYGKNNQIINNRISKTRWGINVNGSGTLIQNNHIFENEYEGVALSYGGNRILGNHFYKNGTDINVDVRFNKGKPNVIKGNKFVEPQHSQTGISVLNSSPIISQNSFIDAVGAAIILNGDLGPQSISQNNFSGNETAIINNTPQQVYADLNYWDSETGPSDTDIVGLVGAEAWLGTPVVVSTAFTSDTLFVAVNTEDSIGLMIRSLNNNPDSISVDFTDQFGWLTGSTNTGAHVDSVGSLVSQIFQTPATTNDGLGNYIFAMASSTTLESTAIDSAFIALYVQEMEDIQVLPDWATAKPGDTIYFEARGWDQHAHEMIINPVWNANLGSISETGMFLYDGDGEVIITATDPESGKEGTTRIYMSSADQLLSSISVSPDTLRLVSGATAYIWPEGFNQFGYPMTFIPSWAATGGEISNGIYLAGSEGGEFVITVSGDEGAVSAEVIVLIEASSGIGSDIFVDKEVLVYPNPTEGDVSIKTGFIIQKIEVLNINGQLIESINPWSKHAEIQLNTQAAGIYFLLIKGANQRLVRQLIVR
ncbi:MAG: NosD domain-containing protein [Bacteroidota bacterium]|nr:NosD domain-containing protein [Bacteroidota bacterium]